MAPLTGSPRQEVASTRNMKFTQSWCQLKAKSNLSVFELVKDSSNLTLQLVQCSASANQHVRQSGVTWKLSNDSSGLITGQSGQEMMLATNVDAPGSGSDLMTGLQYPISADSLRSQGLLGMSWLQGSIDSLGHLT